MAKFDIRKSFEIFWREPLSILKEGLFQIVNINTADNIFEKSPTVNIDFMKDGRTQITVVNSDKMYNLFQTVLFRKRMKDSKEKALSMK
ncbi:hypothetical protein IKP85_01000 [bacterium]|nr:hypothetical protein [bacterium]